MSRIKEIWISQVHQLQNDICLALEKADGGAVFNEDVWERNDGGGGKTRVIAKGKIFEKGGVNTSVVFGNMTDAMHAQLNREDGNYWFACGLSLVLHPVNPFIPTVHCNYRMFELYNEKNVVIDRWFGGGTDLTPYYLFKEDAIHFHQVHKDVCDKYDKTFYRSFKKNCDSYFVNWHRNEERRGIGGIFYDYQKPAGKKDINFWMGFAMDCGKAFLDAYIPIVEKRSHMEYSDKNKYWQEIRRGRYVEFNLIHDRGTLFGLKSNGRTESILMSLPPTVRFEYDHKPDPGSEEDKILQVYLQPQDWVM